MNNLDKHINDALATLDNDYVSAAISLFLVLYAGLAAPKLPETVARLFENTLFRIVIFFLLAYTAKKNASIAAIAAIGLFISLQTLNRYDINNDLKKIVTEEAEDGNVEKFADGEQVEEQEQEQPEAEAEVEEQEQDEPDGISNDSLMMLAEDEQTIPEEALNNMEEQMVKQNPEKKKSKGKINKKCPVDVIPACGSDSCVINNNEVANNEEQEQEEGLMGFDNNMSGFASA